MKKLPETEEKHREQQSAEQRVAFDFLPAIPADLSAQQVSAITDVVFGMTEHETARRTGLSRDQVHRLKVKYASDIASMKACKDQVLKCMVKTSIYTIIQKGLTAAANMPDKAIDSPHKLSALANAAQCLNRLAETIPDSPNGPPPAIKQDTENALKRLKSIQDIA